MPDPAREMTVDEAIENVRFCGLGVALDRERVIATLSRLRAAEGESKQLNAELRAMNTLHESAEARASAMERERDEVRQTAKDLDEVMVSEAARADEATGLLTSLVKGPLSSHDCDDAGRCGPHCPRCRVDAFLARGKGAK